MSTTGLRPAPCGRARRCLIRLWFTDVQGQIKSFAISPAELETAFENGMILTVRQSMDSAVCARKTWSLDLILRPSLMRCGGNDENAARMF